jgi:hypothetical protein
MVGLFSKYFKENNPNVLIHLSSHLNSFNFSISNDFKKICYKKVVLIEITAFIIEHNILNKLDGKYC